LRRASRFIIYGVIFAISAVVPAIAQREQLALPGLAPTPPMGWASWNYYFCDYDEQTIRDQADALVSTGMRDLGYQYVIIQECIAPARDADGHLIPDAKRFPHGIPALVDYIHSRGLKAGIYTDVGPFTCFSATRYQGSYDHEQEDARTFASWGIDLIEVDFCNKPAGHKGKELYRRMAEAIRRTGRPMLLYVCSWGEEQPWEWAPGMAQLWRTTGDISFDPKRVAWKSIVHNFESNALHAAFTAPNSWNDPDMLEVGNSGLTPVESRTHFSMWAISAAPLWAGTDLNRMDAYTLATFTNPEVIAIDQDSLGAGIRRVKPESGGVEIWTKTLGRWSGGSQAVLLLNLASSERKAVLHWSDLGLMPDATVRDLWARQDLGRFPDGYSAEIPAHGSVLLKVSGVPPGKNKVVYEAEWPGNLRPEAARLIPCGTCSGGYAVVLPASKRNATGALIVPQVDALTDSTYRLSVAYLRNSDTGNLLTVRVNESKPVNLQLRGGNGTISLRAELHAGQNRIEIQSREAVAIDCLTVRQGEVREISGSH